MSGPLCSLENKAGIILRIPAGLSREKGSQSPPRRGVVHFPGKPGDKMNVSPAGGRGDTERNGKMGCYPFTAPEVTPSTM